MNCKKCGNQMIAKKEFVLSDYKVTSVYSFLLGDKADWDQQLNLYAWLYRKHGFEAKAAQIVAILRDWVRSRAEHEQNYPPAGFVVKDIPLWPADEQERFALRRVELHQVAEKMADDSLPECTATERWQRPDLWAVKKPANKKAYRVFDNEAAALELATEKKDMAVEFRRGASVRCASYCRVSQFCNWWQQNKPAAAVEEEAAA